MGRLRLNLQGQTLGLGRLFPSSSSRRDRILNNLYWALASFHGLSLLNWPSLDYLPRTGNQILELSFLYTLINKSLVVSLTSRLLRSSYLVLHSSILLPSLHSFEAASFCQWISQTFVASAPCLVALVPSRLEQVPFLMWSSLRYFVCASKYSIQAWSCLISLKPGLNYLRLPMLAYSHQVHCLIVPVHLR